MLLRRADGRRYLERTRLLNTPWLRVFLHRIDTPDPGFDLHDHPWAALRICLAGGYTEALAPTRVAHRHAGMTVDAEGRPAPTGERYRRVAPGRIGRLPKHVAHHIVEVDRPTTTLFVSWGRPRPWGFYTANGWVPYEEHDHAERGNDLTVEGTAGRWD